MKIKLSDKTVRILQALGFLAVIAIMIMAISRMMEIKTKATIDQITDSFDSKESAAKQEREKLSFDNFILRKSFDSLKNDIYHYEGYLIDIKKDYSTHIKQYNNLKNDEKKFIPNATVSEQLDVISTAKYYEFK